MFARNAQRRGDGCERNDTHMHGTDAHGKVQGDTIVRKLFTTTEKVRDTLCSTIRSALHWRMIETCPNPKQSNESFDP